MNTLSYKTISANSANVNKEWLIVDAEGEVLGRLASKVAKLIRGKYKTNFTPHIDCGDNVIVINSEKVRLTGDKWNQREHFTHSGYPGGQKRTTPAQMLAKNPASLVETAVRGMLPKNRLGRSLFNNLHVIVGTEHKYGAQKPKEFNLNTLK